MGENKITKFIHYGEELMGFRFPESQLLSELSINRISPVIDEKELIRSALDHPACNRSFSELAAGAGKVLIISDDNTRPTPVWKIIPYLLTLLEGAGVQRSAITILIASGTHRPMTKVEIEQKLGRETAAGFKVVNHFYKDREELIFLGDTAEGVPIMMNRLAVEADLIIGIGNIVPHRFCGWSGGAKIIVPGICGEETIAGTHLMVTKDPDIMMGVVENSAREEMERITDSLKNLFIINTILNDKQELVGVFAGNVRSAFRKGVEKAETLYTAPIPAKAEIVVASAFPNDLNLWQAGKTFYSADLAVVDGGLIILVSPLHEGVGEHDEFEQLLSRDYQSVLSMIEADEVDDVIGASAVLAVALVRQRASVWIVSDGITEKQAEAMQVRIFPSIQKAVNTALQHYGEHAKVTIIHDATEVLPVLGNTR